MCQRIAGLSSKPRFRFQLKSISRYHRVKKPILSCSTELQNAKVKIQLEAAT